MICTQVNVFLSRATKTAILRWINPMNPRILWQLGKEDQRQTYNKEAGKWRWQFRRPGFKAARWLCVFMQVWCNRMISWHGFGMTCVTPMCWIMQVTEDNGQLNLFVMMYFRNARCLTELCGNVGHLNTSTLFLYPHTNTQMVSFAPSIAAVGFFWTSWMGTVFDSWTTCLICKSKTSVPRRNYWCFSQERAKLKGTNS